MPLKAGAGLRDFLSELDRTGDLAHARREASARYEIPAILSRLQERAILFERVREAKGYRLVGGVCGSRSALARSLGIAPEDVLSRVIGSIENPKTFQIVDEAPCQEVVEKEVDLAQLPILTHCENDGGPYVTAGIVVAKDDELGYNASYHRLMLIGKDRVVARVLPRHLDEFIKRGNRDVGISIGNHPAFLFAAAVSCEPGKSELAIANGLKEMGFTPCATNEALVPSQCELVLEGTVTDEFVDEGPFPDITGAYDIVRKQRVVKIKRVTHRRNPVYQAILPGGIEHRFLMGTPREATIFREVSKVCRCLDVRLTSGGSSWLHAVIKIKKLEEDDASRALEAAFRGHQSLKHAVVVDEDIDTDDSRDIEWAIATRVQMDSDLKLRPNEYGSSLDPSADQVSRKTCKAGLDATIPLGVSKETFLKARIPGSESLKFEEYLE
jgi:2,5-furandicarboxylate decarboxylase 1